MVTMTLQEEKPKVEVGEACKEVDVKDRQACRMWTGSTQDGAVRNGTSNGQDRQDGSHEDNMNKDDDPWNDKRQVNMKDQTRPGRLEYE